MYQVKTYGLVLFSILSILMIVSCETHQVKNSGTSFIQSKSLNLNFQDNILDLNPIEASSASELFIRDLIFDDLFDYKSSAPLIKEYSFDTTSSSHLFLINMRKRFQDGSSVDAHAIRQFFKYLIKEQWNREPVRSFFSSMDGFGAVAWYRENRNILDSIPRGFQILNDSLFKITFTRKDAQIKDWFRTPEFKLFKLKKSRYIGTGSYQLASINEDIAAQLTKTKDSDVFIETINISFIKNQAIIFGEFLEGSLDLITYNELEDPSLKNNTSLTKLLRDKYPEYPVERSNRLIIQFAELKNVSDSLLVRQILGSLKTEKDSIYYLVSNSSNIQAMTKSEWNNPTFGDSLMFEVPIVQDGQLPAKEYFADSDWLSYSDIDKKNLNPIGEHIVIKETTFDSLNLSREKSSVEMFYERLKNPDLSIYIVLEEFQSYVIYSNKLKGIEKNQALSSMVKTMYYQDPKVY